ncbi:MAG: hypothetical protein ACK4OE_01855 [Acidovorax sp.]|uniref:hypothetical protein n=1 Tax=Acidovorax sp. TaxID=1872122 RepID=UPI00391B7DFB
MDSPPPPSASAFDFTLLPLRPLPSFGQRQTLGLSTAVSFDPNTVIMVATGRSLNYVVERMDYGSYLTMQAWVRSVTRGSTMQRETRESLANLVPEPEDINRPPTIEELLALPNAMAGYWRLAFRIFRRGARPIWRGLLVRLAWQDRQLHVLGEMGAEEQATMRAKLFGASIHHWVSSGLFSGSFRPMLVLDMTLQHLAWADVQLSRSAHTVFRTDPIVGLVQPGKVPMRHWFDRILSLTGTHNLASLCDLLAERADKANPRTFTHLELKQWASAQKLMPPGPAHQLLVACCPDVDFHRERTQLWTARWLTFLICYVQGFSTEPVTKVVAQAAINERLTSLRDKLLAGAPMTAA